MVDSFGGASPLRLNREVPVDVSEIRQAPVAGKVVYPIIYRFFAGSLPSTVLNHKGSRSRLAGQK